MLLPAEVIKIKRDGLVLEAETIRHFIAGITSGKVSDAQIAAFTMAVHIQGMDKAEKTALTLAVRDSERRLSWQGLDGPVLDKHSTGGVGDLVSLVLGPMLAACGAYIPMISGRGLGHTGGTLDKLESIPGFNVNPSTDQFQKAVRETGLAFTGQGSDLVPADGRMYAIRDVTATVDSIPLIVASILSKKLAEGLDGLVLDIKTGNGSFMIARNDSRDLALNLVDVAVEAGLSCRALVTDMNEPLARNAGNALEVYEAIEFLTGGRRQPRLADVILALGCEMLILGGLAKKKKNALAMLNKVLDTGLAAEHFARMVALQGGPHDLLEKPAQYLVPAPVVRPLLAESDGWVNHMDTRSIGLVIVGLGGGRRTAADKLDYRVGLSRFRLVGQEVEKGEPLLMIHAADEDAFQRAAAELSSAIVVGRKKDTLPSVYESVP
jgi:thymidine phosphorylase